MTRETRILTTSTPEMVVDLPSATGEGPLWNQRDLNVYWVDIPPGRLYRFDPESGENTVAYQHNASIGGYTFQADGSILLFCAKGQILRWREEEITTVVHEIPEESGGRFNDVIAGPDGHVFCGTMPTANGQARLYRLNLDGSLTTLFDDVGLSNGFGFSPDNRTMYHTDTNKRVIYRLDYALGTGEISNRRVVVQVPAGEGAPDGMATPSLSTARRATCWGRFCCRFAKCRASRLAAMTLAPRTSPPPAVVTGEPSRVCMRDHCTASTWASRDGPRSCPGLGCKERSNSSSGLESGRTHRSSPPLARRWPRNDVSCGRQCG